MPVIAPLEGGEQALAAGGSVTVRCPSTGEWKAIALRPRRSWARFHIVPQSQGRGVLSHKAVFLPQGNQLAAAATRITGRGSGTPSD